MILDDAKLIHAILTRILAGLDALGSAEPARLDLARLQTISLWILLYQIAAGVGVMVFAVRRWYHYISVRRETHRSPGTFLSPRIR